MATKSKESALKALAKKPKLFTALQKGGTIESLKKVGGCSGGFIRNLIWSGVAVLNEGEVSLKKGLKQSDLPDLKAEKAPKEAKKGASKKTGRMASKSAGKASKKEPKHTKKEASKKEGKKAKAEGK